MNILDEVFQFLDDHVAAEPEQVIAMTLYAAASHGTKYDVTFGRMLFTSDMEESGKTHAMMATVALCANPLDTSGTSYSLESALLAATNEPERPAPTLYRDEISDVFGQAGLGGSPKDPVADILRRGYKAGPTRAVSVKRVSTRYSIFTPFLMAGLKTAVPRDIRSRCIVIKMMPGKPRRYWDVRETEPYAQALAASLNSHVKAHADMIKGFRARGIHPRLVNRKLEVWEPLFAVAYALGGQKWLNLAVQAFQRLALDESDVPQLTPSQQIIRDVAHIAEEHAASGSDGSDSNAFIGGLQICDELARLDNPLYTGRTSASLACLVRDHVPVQSEQRRTQAGPVRGYPVQALIDAWAEYKPQATDDAELPVEVNPFET